MVSHTKRMSTYGEPRPCLKTLPEGTVSVCQVEEMFISHAKVVYHEMTTRGWHGRT